MQSADAITQQQVDGARGSYPINDYLIGALDRYLTHGILPGGFLTACLENNLTQAFARADSQNIENLKNIVGYLYNEFPSNAWGSPEKVAEFLKSRAALQLAKGDGE